MSTGPQNSKVRSTLYRALRYPWHLLISNIRKLVFISLGRGRYRNQIYDGYLRESLPSGMGRSDISDHLSTIFYFARDANPKLIVELGTRGGESTKALLAASASCNSVMLSIDMDDCNHSGLPFDEHWNFIKADDIEFGRDGFVEWCNSKSIPAKIGVLFIDTSHEYNHTKQELETWLEYLDENGIIILHDTNMGKGIFSRRDGSIGLSWDNERGVIRALEELMGSKYDESTFFCDFNEEYSLLHFPNCNGLSIIKKV